MMHWYGDFGMGTGMWGFGWFFMILFWAIVIYMIVSFVKKKGQGEDETAEDILKKRYARGEISKEDFERMKTEIREKFSQ